VNKSSASNIQISTMFVCLLCCCL